jgi:hypothetical protein
MMQSLVHDADRADGCRAGRQPTITATSWAATLGDSAFPRPTRSEHEAFDLKSALHYMLKGATVPGKGLAPLRGATGTCGLSVQGFTSRSQISSRVQHLFLLEYNSAGLRRLAICAGAQCSRSCTASAEVGPELAAISADSHTCSFLERCRPRLCETDSTLAHWLFHERRLDSYLHRGRESVEQGTAF